jgi:hypothetical protein
VGFGCQFAPTYPVMLNDWQLVAALDGHCCRIA